MSLLSDRAGNILTIGWRNGLKNSATAEIAGELAWSYGDPLKRAIRAWTHFDGLRQRGADQVESNWESAVNNLIANIPPPDDPVEEPFYAEDDGAMPVTLFQHQREAVNSWFDNGLHGIFEMCTGAGKTITSLACVCRLVSEFAREGRDLPLVLVTVPTRVLADQWCKEIQKMGFRAPVQAYNSHNVFFPDLRNALETKNTETPSFVVTTYKSFAHERVQHLLARSQKRKRQLLWIADEAHNLSTSRLQSCMRYLAGLFSYRMALTATPEIEGQPDRTAFLEKYFRDVVARYTLKNGIDDGVLCSYSYNPVPVYLNPELGARYLELLREIDATESAEKVSIDLYRQKRELVLKSGVQMAAFKGIVQGIIDKGEDMRHTLIYCPPGFASRAEEKGADESDDSVEEGQEERLVDQVTQHLMDCGFEAARILGGTSAHDRERTLEDFRAGRIHAVCAIGCLDEGVDIPSIQRAIVLYSVDREKQFIQRRGRILRQSKDGSEKIAKIIDVVVLPQGGQLPAGHAADLLSKELRRYRTFAVLANNKKDAEKEINRALECAANHTNN